MAAGLPGATPVAMIENASLPTERHFRTRLDLLPLAARTALGDGPALLLIGAAMADHGPERWETPREQSSSQPCGVNR